MDKKNIKIGIVISCRYSSKRLPGKAMLSFGEYTSIGLLVNRLKKSKKIKKIILATSLNEEDDIIENEAKYNSVDCYRGDLENVLRRNTYAAINNNIDFLVRVTGDCPFIDGSFIDKCMSEYPNLENNIYSTKGNFPQGLDIEIVPIKLLSELVSIKNLDDFYKEHMLSYFYERNNEYKIKYFTNNYTNNTNENFTLDNEDDYQKLLKIFNQLRNPMFSIEELLSLLNEYEI